MGTLGVFLILLLNLGVSVLNCIVCGRSWVETRAVGGWPRVMVWCGATQAAIGFSSIYLVLLAWIAAAGHYLDPKALNAMVSLWYLLIIIPALGTGALITVESWRAAYRDRDLLSMGSAAYNSVAMAHNAYGAMSGIGDALGSVAGFFKTDNDGEENPVAVLVILLVVAALGAGVLTTALLIRAFAGSVPLPEAADRRALRV